MFKTKNKLNEYNVITPEEAVKVVRSGDRIFVSSGCATPEVLLKALVTRAPELSDVELVHLLTFGVAPYVDEQFEGSFRHNAFFIGKNVREAVNKGRADFTPIFLGEIPNLFYSGQMRLDVAMVMVSQPDAFGYCSLGIHPDLAVSAIKSAKVVIAQLNKRMPRVHGNTFVHVSRINYFVEHNAPLTELPTVEIDDTSMAIARHVASLINNESTLQMGIGNIPNAVLTLLDNHRDLGVHTEMFSDGVVKLVEADVINNRQKGLHPGKAVASFAMGSKALYDYLDDNPHFEFHPTEYVNSPRLIAENKNMVSINSAIQVDLTGQVCADSMGSTFYSGIGGQVDFIRGAAMSEGGKPIIALPSTARKGTLSRIVTELEPGAGVVTSRGDVHYVVTEFGVAYLHGKTIRERAIALIEIAHPDFRADLRAAALERCYVPVEWELSSEAARYPVDMEETFQFEGGKSFFMRPLRSSDSGRLKEFFYSHDPETVYTRYRFPKKSMPQEEALRLCTLDYSKRFALAVFDEGGEASGQFIAIGRYTTNQKTNVAETAFVVHENYRRHGLATKIYKQLREQALRSGIIGFSGDFGSVNAPPAAMHRNLGAEVFYDEETGLYRYLDRFDAVSNQKSSE